MYLRKIPINLIANFTEKGIVYPITFLYDEKEYKIEKTLNIEEAISRKSGGLGIRYTVKVKNTIIYLWLINSCWYLEQKNNPL